MSDDVQQTVSMSAPEASSTFGGAEPPHKRKAMTRKAMEECRSKAAVKIQQFYWTHVRMRSRLKEIRKQSAATIIQSWYRGHLCRVRRGSVMAEKRTMKLLVNYIGNRHAVLQTAPERHVQHLAARRVQNMYRSFRARGKRIAMEKLVATLKIERCLQNHWFRKYMKDAERRRATQRKREASATIIQSVYRGHRARSLFKEEKETMQREAKERFVPGYRQASSTRVCGDVDEIRRNISTAEIMKVENELLAIVLSSTDPNRDVVRWSAASAYHRRNPVPLERTHKKPKNLPPIQNVRVVKNKNDVFVSQAQTLQPGRQTLLMTEPQPPAVPIVRLKDVRAKAKVVALQRLERQRPEPDATTTMTYALRAHEEPSTGPLL